MVFQISPGLVAFYAVAVVLIVHVASKSSQTSNVKQRHVALSLKRFSTLAFRNPSMDQWESISDRYKMASNVQKSWPYGKYGISAPSVEQLVISYGINNGKPIHRIPIEEFLHTQYYASFALGTPPQEFKVILDTGSADVWVPSSTCYSIPCLLHNRYNSKQSSTFKANGTQVELVYGSGSIKGFISKDTLEIAEINVLGQDFIEAIDESMSFLVGQFDGIFGLAFESISKGIRPPLYNMRDRELIDSAMVSFYLDPSGDESEVIFGAVNPDKFQNPLVFHKVIDKRYWQINLDSVTVYNSRQTTRLKITPQPGKIFGAAIDTGTSLIVASKENIDRINEAIGAQKGPTIPGSPNSPAVVDCSRVQSMPLVSFTFNKQEYVLKPQEYIVQIDMFGQKQCISGFMGMDLPEKMSHLWIVGDVFIRRYYSVFNLDTESVGLARSV